MPTISMTDVIAILIGAEIGVKLLHFTELEPVSNPPSTPLVPEIAE